jgi:hypothetical protein
VIPWTPCPGVGEKKTPGHACDECCERWWCGNGGDRMETAGLSKADRALILKMVDIGVLKVEFLSKLHVCGCHLPWTHYDERGKPTRDDHTPMGRGGIAGLELRQTIAEAATPTRSGEVLPSVSRVEDEGNARISREAARAVELQSALAERDVLLSTPG